MKAAPTRRSAAERRPFVEDYLSYLLSRAAHQVSREFHARLKPYGLSVPQWRVLATLVEANGLSLGALAEAVLFKQPTVTRLIDRTERDGWVERHAGTGDRRRLRIMITPKGEKLVRELLVQAKAHEAEILASYTPAETENLKRILRDLLARSAKPVTRAANSKS
jgi:DNA-binding MarR family transcriptional regulator